jgi:probable lipoprotein (TIGR04455 family)
MRRVLLCVALLFASGCATVKMSRVRSDWAQVDRQQVKRLVVVTSPLPAEQAQVGELWSLVARRYINQKRNFIVKEHLARPDGEGLPASACGEGLEGAMWLRPTVRRHGDGVEAQVDAVLVRCRDGHEVWAAQAGGSWASSDKTLKELTAQYVDELGPQVQPYVAPSFHLLKAALDTLPDPVLTEDDVSEKIELGE